MNKNIKHDIINYLGSQADIGCLPALSIHVVYKNLYYNDDSITFAEFKENYIELFSYKILQKHIGKSNKNLYSLSEDFFCEKNLITRYEYLMDILKLANAVQT